MTAPRETFVIHRIDRGNIGDLACAPTQYLAHFPWLAGATTIDIQSQIGAFASRISGAQVILGGGGLLGTSFFRQQLEQLFSLRPSRLVAWGAGHNDHDSRKVDHLAHMSSFDLAGLRDYQPELNEWVPCVSALMPELERGRPRTNIRHDIVVYRHWDDTFAGLLRATDHPCLTNDHPSLSRTVAFLASGATILTNSYHGVYWGTLLGRRVILVSPFSSKFFALRYAVPVVRQEADLSSAMQQAREYPEALDECRGRNLAFAEKVRALLEL